jgi:hypothetical protein
VRVQERRWILLILGGGTFARTGVGGGYADTRRCLGAREE